MPDPVNVFSQLAGAYTKINHRLFGGCLTPRVLFLPSPRSRPGKGACYVPRIDRRGRQTIVVHSPSASQLRGRDLLGSVLHAMVHQLNLEEGIRDVAEAYHNRRFKDAAESIGLTCVRSRLYGWIRTTLGLRARRAVRGISLDPGSLEVHAIDSPRKKRPPSRWRKWACACGPIRVARSVFKARCQVCRKKFRRRR